LLREGIAVSSKKDVEMNEMLKLVVPIDERDYTLGLADASVTVVNYGDYQCPDCHRRHKEIQRMVPLAAYARR
jgi:protein-disulfide isomerase